MQLTTTESFPFGAGFTGVKELRGKTLVNPITERGSPSFVFLKKER
jgi:hypothetical protein